MSDEIKSQVKDYYNDKLKKFGTTARGVDWNSEESQHLRFRQLSKVLPEDTSESFSILDYGCGYGALYKHLSQHYSNLNFTGFDLSKEMIEASRQLYPNPNARWTSSESELALHDYCIASGIFSVKMNFGDKEWQEYMFKTLHAINSLSRRGFSFNSLTSYSDAEYMKAQLFYPDPGLIFKYCRENFSKQVTLLHDYPLYEFSIIVRK